MKKLLIILCIFFATQLFAQQFEEVVYLKNGSIIRGTIIEQIPNVSLKIQTKDQNVFVFKMAEVLKITKEEIKLDSSEIINSYSQSVSSDKQMTYENEKLSPGVAAVLSLVLTSSGHAYAGNWGRGLLFTAGRVGAIVLAYTVGISEETHNFGGGYYDYQYTTIEPNAFFWIGLLGSVAIGIWEAVDAYAITKDHNKELYKKITGKNYNLSFNIVPLKVRTGQYIPGLGLKIKF